ncbi:MAG: J domain-containing protein [Candidatus Limnocylindrales bacterium]
MVDPYHVLQVIPDADDEVIRAAYRALARKYHPDTGGDQVQMSILNAAWETVGDRAQRARYDSESKAAAAETATASQTTPFSHATASGPATPSSPARPSSKRATSPGAGSGTVLDFGRYAGFSIGELAAADPDYLEWLARTTFGRRLQSEIETVLAAARRTFNRQDHPKSRFARQR